MPADPFPDLDPEAAAGRIRGVLRRTPLQPFALPDGVQEALPGSVELRLKLECLQETGSFKARGAWNQVFRLDEAGRRAGVVATSSGNHAGALAWAAARAGVPATLCMPADAYPNKIEACRRLGATVLLAPDRRAAEAACAEQLRRGQRLVHPYDDPRTAEGAGTVGLEIAEDWPEVDLVLVPVGGGGLASGLSVALRRLLGDRVRILAVEPEGSPTLDLALRAGQPVVVDPPRTRVQGLCPLDAGRLAARVCRRSLNGVLHVRDEEIFAAQAWLVRQGGWIVEPAGAAAAAALLAGRVPAAMWEEVGGRPLRVAAVVSGGNPDPDQLRSLLAGGAGRA